MRAPTSSRYSRRKSRRTEQKTPLCHHRVTHSVATSLYSTSQSFYCIDWCWSNCVGLCRRMTPDSLFYNPYFSRCVGLVDGCHRYRKILAKFSRECEPPRVNLVTYCSRRCTGSSIFELQSYVYGSSCDDTPSQSHDGACRTFRLFCRSWNGASFDSTLWTKYYRSVCFF